MAEYAVAGILHFAKGLHRTAVDRTAGAFDHRVSATSSWKGKPRALSVPAESGERHRCLPQPGGLIL
jgi:hypothetical protein